MQMLPSDALSTYYVPATGLTGGHGRRTWDDHPAARVNAASGAAGLCGDDGLPAELCLEGEGGIS